MLLFPLLGDGFRSVLGVLKCTLLSVLSVDKLCSSKGCQGRVKTYRVLLLEGYGLCPPPSQQETCRVCV